MQVPIGWPTVMAHQWKRDIITIKEIAIIETTIPHRGRVRIQIRLTTPFEEETRPQSLLLTVLKNIDFSHQHSRYASYHYNSDRNQGSKKTVTTAKIMLV